MIRELKSALWMTLALALLTGILYPLAVTGLAQVFFSRQANGSLLERHGTVIGSKWIGQQFSSPRYFHGRPSDAGNGYDPTSSGASNLAPTSRKLIETVKSNADAARKANPQEASGKPVPVDLVTASGSGLDPEISLAAALYQVPRVALARKMDPDQVEALVRRHTIQPTFGIFGERRVNVLELNLALDNDQPK